MAIELDIVQQAGIPRAAGNVNASLYSFPPSNVSQVSAAGLVTLTRFNNVITLRNHGDAVFVRLNINTDNNN